jgi:hypothetical protein
MTSPSVLAAVPSLVVQNAATSLHTNPPSVSLVSAQSASPLVAGPLCVLDLQSLARVINMQAVHTLVDPIGCGLASLLAQLSALVLSQRAYTAATASIYGSSQRRVPPTPQLSLAQSGGDMAVLSLSLPVTLSGLLYLAACAPYVCIKLPDAVLHDLPLDVQRWVQQLQQQHRLQVVMGYSQPSGLAFAPHACLWLCIFNSAAMRNTLVLPHQLTSTGLSVVHGCESGHSPGRGCF